MKALLVILLFIGCASSKPLDEMYTDESRYVIQVDQFYRYRIIMPNGEDMGARLESFDEAQVAVIRATIIASEMILENKVVEDMMRMDEVAQWKTVERE